MDLENIQKRTLDDFNSRTMELNNHFTEIHQSFFNIYQDEIKSLKKKLISEEPSTYSPKDIWSTINEHLNEVRNKIVMQQEKYNQALEHLFWLEWKEKSTSILGVVPEKYSTSFILEKFKFQENDSFKKRQLKRFSLFHYKISNKLYRFIRKNKRFLDSGRTIYPHNLLHHYLFLPTTHFMIDRWNLNLKNAVKTLDLLSRTTEKLKDEVLAVQNLPDKEIYWKKVINFEIKSIITNYESAIKQIEESAYSHTLTLSADIHFTIHDISQKLEQNWTIAGTSLLPGRKYGQRKINSQWRLISRRHQRLKDIWGSHLKKLHDEWLKNIDLAQIQLRVAEYRYDSTQIVKNKFYNDIVPLFRGIINKIKETNILINSELKDIKDKGEIKNNMLLLNRKLVRAVRDKDLPDLLALLDPKLFSHSFSGFIKRMNSDVETLPEEHIVLTQMDMESLPIKIKSDKVALKDILQGETFHSSELKIEKLNEVLCPDLDASSRSLSRIDQILEYNFEGALNKIREEKGETSLREAIVITQEGLERVEQTIEDLMNTLKSRIDESLKNFDMIAADLEEEVQVLGDNERLLELKIRLTRARTRAKITEYRKQIWQYIRLFLPKLLQFSNDMFKKILDRYSKVRHLARLDISDIQSEISFSQYLTDVENKINRMPYIYRRIFRTEALEDNKFFVGRADVLKMINQDFEDFKKNYHPLTALVGEKGSGKTSTLNFARRNILKGFQCTEIDITYTISTSEALLDIIRPALSLPEVQTIDDVINALNGQQKNKICIVENIHNLFIRTIEGFQALDDFLLLISKTRQNVFWIVSCGRYAWEYLETVTRISSFFKRIIHLEDLSTAELKDMILSRHQISGYGINYIPTEKIVQSRQYKKITNPSTQQHFLEDLFFKRLSESAEGNVRMALYFWLSAIDIFEESDINIALDIKSESQFLHQLPTDEILTLAAFIQHEYLDEQKHAMIFNQAYSDSRIHIEKLFKKGLLLKIEDFFMIHPYLYRPVVKALKMRNII
jgi:hypothetical protein